MASGQMNSIQVGALDPELNTSPILEDTDEEFEAAAQGVKNSPICYFNNVGYENGEYVRSGSGELFRCNNGIWVR